jgi:hypothetical protein
VLLSDREAEHIPGCNMAFRKSWLERIGGFDPQFRTAGDDVDLCWRLQETGGRLGFHPGAVVWHHRRNSVRRYWKQQVGYGKAEALLARKWPQKYNSAAHIPWSGRIYGRGLTRPLFARRGRVYQGVWGSAPFQSVYQPAGSKVLALTLLPEWYLLLGFLAVLSVLALDWAPLGFSLPLLALGVGAVAAQAVRSAAQARLSREGRSWMRRLSLRALVAFLHLAQPAARLWGRLAHGLDPWRMRSLSRWTPPRTRQLAIWSESWRPQDEWLRELEATLLGTPALVRRGGECDAWDLGLVGGPFGCARVLMAVEEHGRGRQCVRFRVWPTVRRLPFVLFLAGLASAALFQGAWLAGATLGATAFALGAAALRECGASEAEIVSAVRALEQRAASPSAAEAPVLSPARLAIPHA